MHFYTNKRAVVVAIVVVLLVGGYFVFREKPSPERETFVVTKRDLQQEVNVTGRVKPATTVDLAFEKSGKVTEVAVTIGDTIQKDAVLVRLDDTELQAQKKQYEAARATQRAKLDELKRGTRAEEITIVEIDVANAKRTLDDARTNQTKVQTKADIDLANLYAGIRDLLNDAGTKADDAVQKQIDDLFSNDATDAPRLTFTTELQAKTNVEVGRVTAGGTLTTWKAEIRDLGSETPSLDRALISGERSLSIIRNFLEQVSEAVNAATGLSPTTVATYKGNVNTARTNVNTALTNVSAKRQAIAGQRATNQNAIATAEASVTTANNTLRAAEAKLSLKQAGATQEEVKAQAAQVQQAEANLLTVLAQLEKTVLRSPITGIVTKQDAKKGEIVTANTAIVSVISAAAFAIEANVPEADIAKLAIGKTARITLDAYGSDVMFDGTVATIDPAEVIIDGVATYKTTFQFLKQDDRVKSGMTANIDILADERTQVLTIPQRALTTKDGVKTVRILEGKDAHEITITTGLKALDGMVEIVSGLSDGDTIILSE